MTPAEKALYERVGGYDVIAAMTDDLLCRVTKDPQLCVYWKGHSNDSMKRDRQLIVDFLCESTGGPVVYRGRDMKTSHEGLHISERDWEVFVGHTVATLDRLEVYGTERDDCLDVVAGIEVDVVERA